MENARKVLAAVRTTATTVPLTARYAADGRERWVVGNTNTTAHDGAVHPYAPVTPSPHAPNSAAPRAARADCDKKSRRAMHGAHDVPSMCGA